LYVIDIRDREVKKRVPIGFPATDVEVLESKGKLYVANFLGHEVKVIELDSFEVVKEVEVGSGPREISITPDGKEAWVAVHNIDNVSVIDTERDEVVKNFYLYDKVVGDMP
ncbi:MAG: hypothetical protein GWN86_07280, partial [Desulfobacterales bacterium]|nr:hypothetical protein [Desulfobacterales bacterium]